MAKCAYCDEPLPERGFTHYMLCEGRLGELRPACTACRRRLHLVMVDLKKEKK